MDEIKPICRFDPARPKMFRDNKLLRAVLQNAIPAMQPELPVQEAAACR
jgi:hypothetical protein